MGLTPQFSPTNVCSSNSLSVPGGIAPESLTFTPLDDMIFLKWEEPVEPNGLITQYEVRRHATLRLFFRWYFICSKAS